MCSATEPWCLSTFEVAVLFFHTLCTVEFIYTHACIDMHMDTCSHMCLHSRTCMHTCIHDMDTYAHAHAHVHNMHAHLYTHT